MVTSSEGCHQQGMGHTCCLMRGRGIQAASAPGDRLAKQITAPDLGLPIVSFDMD